MDPCTWQWALIGMLSLTGEHNLAPSSAMRGPRKNCSCGEIKTSTFGLKGTFLLINTAKAIYSLFPPCLSPSLSSLVLFFFFIPSCIDQVVKILCNLLDFFHICDCQKKMLCCHSGKQMEKLLKASRPHVAKQTMPCSVLVISQSFIHSFRCL